MNPYDAPGLSYVGHISHPRVNCGRPLPVFEPVAPEGSPDINTMDGWNALTDRVNRRSFLRANGREPVDDAELHSWVEACL